ncbi:phage tail tape measure protein [Pseudomonas aeruginosa]|nr:phage tail tape measure protein [Pseudomonas aeruginosa]MCU9088408.1 phage tail tape measure protein [Pseudomonas aeruginosa]
MTAAATSQLDFILRLVDQVTAPAAKVSKQLMDVAEVGKTGFMQMGAGVAGVVGSAIALQEAMAPALDQQRALGEVKSLGVAQEALDELSRKSLEFSVAYGENAQAFVRSAYDIQSAIAGLTGSQLSAFTNASNVLAKATKADAATVTSYVGTMYGIFKNQADAMGKAEWVENLAGQTGLAVQMFKTTGQQMSDAFTAVGANATSAGIGLSEQMAILGTLQATMSGGEAGTKYKSFLAGVGGAQEKLGLAFTDSQGRMLPMLQILDKLKVKFGDTLNVAESDELKKAFGSDEAVGLIKLLMSDTAGLTNNMEQLGKVKGMEQAEMMAQAMVDPWERFGSAVEAVRIAFGQTLLPVLNPLMERLAEGAGTLQRWVGMFPNIARWLGYLTLGVLGLVAAAGALTMLGGLFSVLSVLASPIALIVIGVVALVAAVAAAIIWWDELKAAYGDTAWFQALMVIITPIVLIFKAWWAVMQLLWQGVQQLWAMGVQFVTWLASFEVVATSAKAIWDGLMWAFANLSPFALLGKALKGIIELLNTIPGVEINTSFADLPDAPKVPQPQGASLPTPSTPAVDNALAQAMPKAPMPLMLAAPQAVEVTAPTIPRAPVPEAPMPALLAPAPAVEVPAATIPRAPVPEAPMPAMLAPVQAVEVPAATIPRTPVPEAPMPAMLAPVPAVEVTAATPPQPPAPSAPMPATLAPVPVVVEQAAAMPQQAERGQQARQAINDAIPSLSPSRPSAVPPGGLLTSIQNTNSLNKGTHVEKVEIHTSKPMSPLELESMLEMSAG